MKKKIIIISLATIIAAFIAVIAVILTYLDLESAMGNQSLSDIKLYSSYDWTSMRYDNHSGNDLEYIVKSQYKGAIKQSESDAVQISVFGNDMTIDVYVKFTGETELATENGTPCKDLALAGIEVWSGYYRDVFDTNISVVVSAHEIYDNSEEDQEYIEICLKEGEDIPATVIEDGHIKIVMPTAHFFGAYEFADDEYLRVVSHEIGHAFGIDEGFIDQTLISGKIDGRVIEHRLEAEEDYYRVKPISYNDVMVNPYDRLSISSTEIELLIIANDKK